MGSYYLKSSVLLLALVMVFMTLSSVFSSTVTVSATVSASSVTCTTDNNAVSLGTLTTGGIGTATPNASTSLSCNSGLGCTLNINDSNAGLATTSPAYTIPSVTATLAAGTEGYGIQAATTTAGSGGTLGVNSSYLVTGNNVGRLNTTSTILASSTASIAGREVVVTHKAAISALTAAANYSDTITYSCTGN